MKQNWPQLRKAIDEQRAGLRPDEIGWERKYERNVHLNNHVERDRASGRRVPKLPTLEELEERGEKGYDNYT